MPSPRSTFVTILSGAVVCASAAGQTPTLSPLPIRPTCISRNGLVVAGDDGVGAPMRWTKATGASRLVGPNGEKYDGRVWAANDDGSVLVGVSHFGDVSNPQAVFVWSATTGMVDIAAGFSETYGVTDDGNVVAVKVTNEGLPKVWRRDAGFQTLPLPDDATSGQVLGISGDGSVAIGEISSPLGSQVPAKWHLNDGSIDLLTDGEQYLPRGFGLRCSRDGSVVLGIAYQVHLIYWTSNGFWDFGVGSPWALSSDGRVAVGRPAFLYTPGLGPVNIRTFVSSTWPIDTSDWTPTACTGVSGDGHVIVGFGGLGLGGGKTDGWLLQLPPRPPGDFNCDWFTDIYDLNDFVNCFEGTSLLPAAAADVNGDGFVDIWDFQQFVEDFER